MVNLKRQKSCGSGMASDSTSHCLPVTSLTSQFGGFALFLKKEFEETAETEEEAGRNAAPKIVRPKRKAVEFPDVQVQNAILDAKKFGKIMTLHAWTPQLGL